MGKKMRVQIVRVGQAGDDQRASCLASFAGAAVCPDELAFAPASGAGACEQPASAADTATVMAISVWKKRVFFM